MTTRSPGLELVAQEALGVVDDRRADAGDRRDQRLGAGGDEHDVGRLRFDHRGRDLRARDGSRRRVRRAAAPGSRGSAAPRACSAPARRPRACRRGDPRAPRSRRRARAGGRSAPPPCPPGRCRRRAPGAAFCGRLHRATSSSRPASGFTLQRATSPRPTRSTHALQAMHGRTSFEPPLLDLARPVGLGDQRAAEQHQVGVAGLDHLRGERGIVEPADGDHRDVHGRLDRGREVAHVPARDEHRRERHVQRVPGAGADADGHAAGLLEPARDLHALVEREAAGHRILAVDAPHQRQRVDSPARPRGRSARGSPASRRRRRSRWLSSGERKFDGQIAVRAVDLDELEAGLGGVLGRLRVVGDDVGDLARPSARAGSARASSAAPATARPSARRRPGGRGA